VSTAYLHSEIDKDIYVKPPPELEQSGKVWLLKRSLYGLKQSGRNWYLHLSSLLKKCGLTQSDADPGLFFNLEKRIYVLIYVDDILVIAPSDEEMRNLFAELAKALKIKDLGPVTRFLGWQVERKESHFEVHQTDYIDVLLQRYEMIDCDIASTPMARFELDDAKQEVDAGLPVREIVGSLLYLAF
ncbi:Reverse transcriptase, RNA-dependent DNA polymerase domain protein, partial [mine drainage metagenome]